MKKLLRENIVIIFVKTNSTARISHSFDVEDN